MDFGFTMLRRPDSALGDSDALRPLDWGELCARLAAMQQLRRAMAGGNGGVNRRGDASFAPSAALMLAAGGQGPRDVNLEPLADRKPGDGMESDRHAARAAHDDRDRGQQ